MVWRGRRINVADRAAPADGREFGFPLIEPAVRKGKDMAAEVVRVQNGEVERDAVLTVSSGAQTVRRSSISQLPGLGEQNR
jgi:hypothetical protein